MLTTKVHPWPTLPFIRCCRLRSKIEEIDIAWDFAAKLNAYSNDLPKGAEKKLVKPSDSVMLAGIRALDETIATTVRESRIEAQDDLIRSKRQAVRIRSYLFVNEAIRGESADYEYFTTDMMTKQMKQSPYQPYKIDAEMMIFEVQSHFWKMFNEANEEPEREGAKFGVACHPTALLVLLEIEKAIRKVDKGWLFPCIFERMLEDHIERCVDIRRSRSRMPVGRGGGIQNVAWELVERTLYSFVRKELPVRSKYHRNERTDRKVLFKRMD